MIVYNQKSKIIKIIVWMVSTIIWNYFLFGLLIDQWNPLYWKKTPLCFFITVVSFSIIYKRYVDINEELDRRFNNEMEIIENLRDRLYQTADCINSIERKTKQIMATLKMKSNGVD